MDEIEGPDGNALAVVWTRKQRNACETVPLPEGEANARLIAAAPDLLKALEECITNDGAPAWNDKMMAFRRLHAISDIARAAIAKAKGEG
jgi:hypothetical protein